MCLLWRKCEEGLETFITRVSTVAAIAIRLQKWRTDDYPPELYTVMGPNCSRVASTVCRRIPCGPAGLPTCHVLISSALRCCILRTQRTDSDYQCEKDTDYIYELLRCYDSRLIETDRMPNVYWLIDLSTGGPRECNCPPFHTGETDYRRHDVNLMLIQDDPRRYPLNFGRNEESARTLVQGEQEEFDKGSTEDDRNEADESDEDCTEIEGKLAAKDTMDPKKPPGARRRQDYFWEQNGDFLVIRVPFWKGDHFACKPSDFSPIIQFLRNLHDQKLFHGDIRCFNIIFSEHDGKLNGKLIDFDFGGRAGERHYPRGYVSDLPDGCRLGEQKKLIENYHEWHALAHCMFVCHKFQTEAKAVFDELLRFRDEVEVYEDDPDGLTEYIRKITSFLTDTETEQWECIYQQRFKMKLEQMLGGTFNPATGSPRPLDDVWRA
jgi:hypothetical protein